MLIKVISIYFLLTYMIYHYNAIPNNQICSVRGSFHMDIKDSAKNPVKQAYTAAKTVATYKDMADA